MVDDAVTKYLADLGEDHRKRHGQFFTPPQVAHFMVDWVMRSRSGRSLFDPGLGLGAFHDCVAGDGTVSFSANEIDPHVLNHWKQRQKGGDASVRLQDYLASWGCRHNNIVCNPPYARFQHFKNRHAIADLFAEQLQVNLSGYTNIASMFLLKSIHELKKGGRLAYIMPLEFLNTGYGKLVKQRLVEKSHLHSIIKLDCEKEVFPDVTTTVGIILYDASRQHSAANFFNVQSVGELRGVLKSEPTSSVAVGALNPDEKWMPYFDREAISVRKDQAVQLSYYGNFSRGIATGANEFFAVSPSQAKKVGIEDYVIPCITRSAQVDMPIFKKRQYDALMKKDARVLLFSPKEGVNGRAAKYIQYGEQLRFNERYITKCRNPWYKMEHRDPSPILLNVFSRDSYKIVLNKSGAVNLTCYHGFQPNLFGEPYVEKLFLYLSSKVGRSVLSLSKRVYGRALDKFEPNDLNGAFVPKPELMDRVSGKEAREAMRYLEAHGAVPDAIEDTFSTMML